MLGIHFDRAASRARFEAAMRASDLSDTAVICAICLEAGKLPVRDFVATDKDGEVIARCMVRGDSVRVVPGSWVPYEWNRVYFCSLDEAERILVTRLCAGDVDAYPGCLMPHVYSVAISN